MMVVVVISMMVAVKNSMTLCGHVLESSEE